MRRRKGEYSKGSNLTAGITDQLGRAIVAGEYRGRGFPIEAEIADQFRASRSITREAIKMLTAKGLITSRPRHGTSVAPEANWNFLDADVLRWILDSGFSLDLLAEFTAFRTAIEPQAAELAIKHADSASIARINEALLRMELAESTRGNMLQADIDFHVAILEASGNRFMIQCRDLVATALKFSIQMTNSEKGVPGADIEAHRAIANAITERDVQGATRATRAILEEAAMLIERARDAAN